MYMDTKKIKIVIAALSFLSIVFLLSYLFVNIYEIKNSGVEEAEKPEASNEETKLQSEAYSIDDISWDEEPEESFIINNSIDEILERLSASENEDKVGKFDGEEIYVFKYPELTTRPLLYSNSEIMVKFDDYVCVRYEPEKANEKYILIVYYFDADQKWESWYKYIFAKNNKEAEKLAEEEKEHGYAVWTTDNVILVGEQVDNDVTEEVFLDTLENKIIYLN